MAGKLPKVTEYIKNVGKSIGYASIDAVKESTEGTSSFLETNEEFFKTIYSASKNYKRTLITTDKIIRKSKLYDAVTSGIRNTKEDLISGNWYNKERDNQMQMAAFGEDFADFSDFDVDLESDDWNMDDDEDIVSKDEPSKPKISTTDKVIAQAATSSTSSIVAATREQSHIIANSTESLVGVNIATAKMLSMQNEKLQSSILAGFQDVHSGLGIITSMMAGPMTTYMNESTKFYTDTSSRLTEMSAYLKEMTEMQRNLYKVQQDEYKQSKYDEVVDSNNMPDLKAYGKRILKNIKDLDPTAGMLFGEGDENPLKAMMGSPLKFLPRKIIQTIIPTTVNAAMKAFDENMKGFFPSFIAKMNQWAEEGSDEGINFKGIIGSLLGIKVPNKTSLNTGAYKKRAMPFDGETKKAIVDVIPMYLSRIESALSGQPERVFDYNSGSFKTARQVHKEFKQKQLWAQEDAASSIESILDDWSKDKKGMSKLQRRKMLREVARELYANGGRFDVENDALQTIFGSEKDMLDFINYVKEKKKTNKIYEIAGNSFRARENYTKQLEEIEKQFGNPFQILFNNQLLTTDAKGKIKAFNAKAGIDANSEEKLFKRDKRFKTTNDYLKDILANIIYIRENLGRGSKPAKKGKHSSVNTNPVRTIDEIQASLNEEGNFEYIEAEKDELVRLGEEKEKSQAEKYGLTKDNILRDIQAAKTFSDKWKALRKGIDDSLQAPAKIITKLINKADQRLFDALFGSADGIKKKDKEGREYNGLLDYLVTRSSEFFNEIRDKLKSTFDKYWDKFKESSIGKRVIDIGNKTKSALSSKFGAFKRRGRTAYDRTYGIGANAIASELRSRGVIGADDISDIINGSDDEGPVDSKAHDSTQLDDNGNPIQHSALGRVVQKYGLSMVSPGEIIIPNRGKGRQQKDLQNEKREKSKILRVLKGLKISHNATGTVKIEDRSNKKKDSDILMGNVKKVIHQVAGEEGDIIADSLIGGGVSLLTGAIGGPLLGAAVGASYGLVKNSDFLQEKLFGKKDEKGERKGGGFVPKSVMDFFKKHSEGMIDFGMAGAVAGLFTPLGLVGGAMAGAALGYAKDTKWFKDFMFGNETEGKEGVFSQETQKKIKEAFPAIATGAGAGILLGPFGLVGNALLGSAAGYVSTTDTFKKVVLGEMGDDGKRHGGVVGAFKEGLVDPLIEKGKEISTDLAGYALEQIVKPTKLAFEVGGQLVKNIFTSIGDRISDSLNGVFEKYIGMPMEEFLREKVFKRISNFIGGIVKAPLALAKGVISAPFKALGATANMVQLAQIRRGTSGVKNAQARIDTRSKHKWMGGIQNIFGRDNTLQFDTQLAGMDSDDLYRMNEVMSSFINDRGKSTKDYHDKIRAAQNIMINNAKAKGDYGDTQYNGIEQISKALQRGERPNADLLRKYGFDDSILEGVDINELMMSHKESLDKLGITNDELKKLEKLTGMKGISAKSNNRGLKKMQRLIQSELDYKTKLKNAHENNPDDKELAPLPEFDEKISNNTDRIVEILSNLEEYITTPMSRKKRKVVQYNPNGVSTGNGGNTKDGELAERIEETDVGEEMGYVDENVDQRTLGRWMKDFMFGNAKNRGARGWIKTAGQGAKAVGKMIGKGARFIDPYTSDIFYKATNIKNFGLDWLRWNGVETGANLSHNQGSNIHGDPNDRSYKDYDSKEANDARVEEQKEEDQKKSFMDKIAELTDHVGNMLGVNKEKEEENQQKSLISRIFGKMGPIGSNILGVIGNIGGGLKTVGMIGAGIGSLALLGWGSEFWNTKVSPWFEEKVKPFLSGLMEKVEQSETFQKIKSFVVGIKEKWEDGTIIAGLVSKMSQGVSFAIKNVVGPLVSAIIGNFPALVAAIAKGTAGGVRKLFDGNKDGELKTNFSAKFKANTNSMIVGKDEAEIAKDFSGNTWNPGNASIDEINDNGSTNTNKSKGKNNALTDVINGVEGNHVSGGASRASLHGKFGGGSTSMPTYNQNGTFTEEDGSITEVNGDEVSRYDSSGKKIGSYLQSTGEITEYRTVGQEDASTGGLNHGMWNAVTRGISTGPSLTASALRGLSKISPGSIVKSFAKGSPLGLIAGAASGAVKAGAKITGSVLGVADNLGSNIHNLIKGTTKLADDSIIMKIVGYAKNILGKVFKEDGVVTKFLAKHLGKSVKLITPLSTKLVDAATKLLTNGKFSGKVAGTLLGRIAANTSPLALIEWAKSLADGFTQTESILGVAKETLDLPLGARALTAVVHALNENIFFGFIETKQIVDVVMGIFGSLGGVTSEELESARDQTEELLARAGIATGEIVTINDYNHQTGLWTLAKRFFTGEKNPMDKLVDDIDISGDDYNGSGRKNRSSFKGKGRGGSQGGMFANLPYGKSTIGEAGCAPVAASMVGNSSVPEAALFAQKTGHVAPDGSTDIGFFNDYFSAKGISNKTTTDKSLTEKALRKGGSAVLLGRDPGGGDQSAYSNSSHFITAKGMDRKGNVMIDDPEMGSRIMKKNDVFRNMKASVVTGKGRYKGTSNSMTGVTGSERREMAEQDAKYYEQLGTMSGMTGSERREAGLIPKTTKTTNGYYENVKKIIDTARSQIGKTEKPINDCIYNDEFYGGHVSGSSYPWCCAFVWWVFHHAGADALITKTASCTTMMQWFAGKGQIVKMAQPGDLLFFNFDKTKSPGVAKHVGICSEASTNGKTVKSIEGNTSSGKSGSQDNGGGVFERERQLSNVVAIARPAYSGASFEDAIPFGNYDYATGEEISGSSGIMGLFEKIAALGKLAVKAIFGEGLYNAVFGNGSDSSTSYSSGGSSNADIGYAADPTLPSNVGEDEKLQGANPAERIWKYLRSLGYSKAGTAGIMGNLAKESGLQSNNLQNSFNTSLGLEDADYTKSVNNGSYSKSRFTGDKAGYGLAQWTYSSRKAGLFDATIGKDRPIDSEKGQLDYLSRELTQYGLSDQFKSAGNVDGASDYFLTQFEKPANMEQQKSIRRKSAQSFYDQFSGYGRRKGRSSTNNVTTSAALGMKEKKGQYSGESFDSIIGNQTASKNKRALSGTISTVSNGYNVAGTSIANSSNSQLAYATFLETIVDILLSISGNTESLTKILDILSKNFDINVNTDEIQKTTKSAKEKARAALSTLMSDKTDAESVSHLLQSRDTDWLVRSMTELAKE